MSFQQLTLTLLSGRESGMQVLPAVQKYPGSSKESNHSISSALATEGVETEIALKNMCKGKQK